jgi:hypothetical protein
MDSPQRSGGCLCSDIRYRLRDEPLTVYACHCTDCQRQTGSSFSLSMIVRREALQLVQGRPNEYLVELPDGRRKQSSYCSRCSTRLWSPSRAAELAVLEAGTLDDASGLRPVGHIWTRSAQPWVQIPAGVACFAKQPSEADSLELVRAWKAQESVGNAGG